MPARLEAEARTEIVVVLLEVAPFLADGGAGQSPQTAREQTHADSSGVKVDGRDHAIGAHGHLTSFFLARSYRRHALARRLATALEVRHPRAGGSAGPPAARPPAETAATWSSTAVSSKLRIRPSRSTHAPLIMTAATAV